MKSHQTSDLQALNSKENDQKLPSVKVLLERDNLNKYICHTYFAVFRQIFFTSQT